MYLMKKIILFITILFFCLNSYSQKKFSAEVLTGIGLNKSIFLLNQNIENHTIYSTQVNAFYAIKLYKTIFAETGLGAQWYFASGSVELSEFNTTSLRLNLPFVVSYPILSKINIGAGVTITNNKDFENLAFRSSNNLRTSLVLRSAYKLQQNFSILLMLKHNLSNIPDLFLVNQPNTSIALGVSYKLF